MEDKREGEENENEDGPGYDEEQLKQAKRVLAGTASIVKAKTAYSSEFMPDTLMLKDGSDL